MRYKNLRFSWSLVLTSASLFAVMLILGAAGDRSAAAQPIGDSSAPLSLQSTTPFTIGLQFVANELTAPVHVTNAHDDTGRLFVVEQAGTIRVIKNGSLLGTPYLDIHTRVESGGSEQGLLSVAFDPNYKTNGTFYVDYTTNASGHDGDTVIARYVISNPLSDVGTVISATNLITIDQPESNHNGGQLQFGPDGYLYIGMGDGGGGGDLHGTIGNGQNLTALLGKILRINVRDVPTYTLPPSNPFTQTLNARPEIWAYGLRNPWRFSFDRSTGDLYIGDVGQGCWEEIDYQPAGSHGGENYGWRLMEGFHYFDPNNQSNCSQPTINLITLTLPITNYDHDQGNAVAGGYVYRGSQYLWLNGIYFYGDEGSGRIWAAQPISPSEWSISQKLDTTYNLSSFGEDQSGEIYAIDYSGGAIYKLVSAPPIDFSASTKQASTGTAQSGGSITYTIVLRNSRNLISNTLRVTDVIPIGLSYVNGSFTATRGTPIDSAVPTLNWSGVMSNTSIVTLTYAASVVTTTNQTITNAAMIDPAIVVPLTRTASVTIVNPSPDLSTSTKQSSTSSAIFGDSVTYTIVLRNSGGPLTTTARLTDVVPAGLSYLSGSLAATLGTLDDSTPPTLKWYGLISAAPVVTISYAARVATAANQMAINVVTIDPAISPVFTRSASVAIASPVPNLSPTTKQVSASTAALGDTLTYTIVLRNGGDAFPQTLYVTDTLPISLGYIIGSFGATSGIPDASAAPTLKWHGALSATSIITLTYAVTVTTSAAQVITNQATVDVGLGTPFTRSASVLVNGWRVYLPLILKAF